MLKVSVIIPSYNTAVFLPLAIDSVLKQTYSDYEIVIVDDGSTDDTKQIVEKYIQFNREKIRYIHEENQGVSTAKNTGIKNARGEYIALLDADDEWLPERLAEGVRVLEARPEIGLVHGNSMRITESGDVIRINKRDPRLLNGWIFTKLFLRKADVSCATVLFRKSCVDRVGDFDEKLSRLGCEDREMWLRIAQYYPFAYIDKVLARYRVRGVSMSKNREKMLQGRYYVINKLSKIKRGFFLKRRALAYIHKEVGDEFLLEKDFRKARVEYLKALSFWPLSFWIWLNLSKTMLKRN